MKAAVYRSKQLFEVTEYPNQNPGPPGKCLSRLTNQQYVVPMFMRSCTTSLPRLSPWTRVRRSKSSNRQGRHEMERGAIESSEVEANGPLVKNRQRKFIPGITIARWDSAPIHDEGLCRIHGAGRLGTITYTR
ncbi:MAG: hypothetical protein CM1200mP39_09850 [Dehalococcoidia bacterium]|nr:MAG: hypothetical protein CM1200mP39_09850 [Dehalococcoidia bacterium]